MTFRDTWATCAGCGREFVFRVNEQRRQAERGEEIAPPELCPACRALARAERRPGQRTGQRSRPAAGREPKKVVVLGAGPHEGKVKWYDHEKGYGFIIHPSGEEIFFHRTGIVPGEIPDFPDGTPVTYLVEQTQRGPQAVDVERMGTQNDA